MRTDRRRPSDSRHDLDQPTILPGKHLRDRRLRRLVNVEPLEGRVLLSIVPGATAPPDQVPPTASVEKASGPAMVGDSIFVFTVDYQDNIAVAGNTIDS